jgi:hypothetical protein
MPKKNGRTLLCETLLKQRHSNETLGNESDSSTSEEGEKMETELNNTIIKDGKRSILKRQYF